ncbi:MAG: tetratricopeptide repeat protein [Paracoccaceae bacterium]|nr:tetratricopeptide repeat protein [Paracoccaceae bacterium]
MSNTDSFIEEVTEEVRRDRLFAFFRKYGWLLVLAAVAVVGYTAWNQYRIAQEQKAARAFGDAVSAAELVKDPAARVKALEAIKATGGREAVLRLLIASYAVQAGDTKTADAALQAVAANGKLAPRLRDLAALKQIMTAGASMDAAAKEAALGALSQAGRPYRPLALEQLALLKVQTGDTQGAIKAFKELLQEPGLTQALRQRATSMIVALGGNPAAG